MSDAKYIRFISEILKRTKEKRLEWRYLDTNQALYEGMGWVNKKIEYGFFTPNKVVVSPDFNDEDSFFARIDNVFVVIYVKQNQPAKLFVVPETYKKVVVLTPNEYGEYITQLLNLVQSQFPDGESFIDGIINTDARK